MLKNGRRKRDRELLRGIRGSIAWRIYLLSSWVVKGVRSSEALTKDFPDRLPPASAGGCDAHGLLTATLADLIPA